MVFKRLAQARLLDYTKTEAKRKEMGGPGNVVSVSVNESGNIERWITI